MTERTVKDELANVEAAYEAEKAGLEQTITQLKTDLEKAEQGDLLALAALQGQLDSLGAKVRLIDTDRDLWRKEAWWRRELAGEKKYGPQQPNPPETVKPEKIIRKLVGSSITPDAAFSLDNYTGDLQKVLTAIDKAVKTNAKQTWPKVSDIHIGNVGRLHYAVTAAVKGMVGRSVHTYLGSLEFLARAFGTDWHITESVRLFDQLRKNLLYVTETYGGIRLSYYRMRNKFNELYASKAGDVSDDGNDKESTLGHSAVSDAQYRFWTVKEQPGMLERAEFWQEVLLLEEARWWLKTGGIWRFPTDRTQHAHTATIKHYIRQYDLAVNGAAFYERMAKKVVTGLPEGAKAAVMLKASDRAAFCKGEIEKRIRWQQAEMKTVAEVIGGETLERLTWAYNCNEGTLPAQRNPGNTDGFQPTTYIWMCEYEFMDIGLWGYGRYAAREFQEKMANTQYALAQPEPLRYRVTGSDKWNDTLLWTNNAPIDKRVPDGYKNPKQVTTLTFENEYGTRTLIEKATQPGSQKEFYYEKERWGDDAGIGLMFATESFLKRSRAEWGDVDSIKSQPHEIGWTCGYALRLGLEQKLFTWD